MKNTNGIKEIFSMNLINYLDIHDVDMEFKRAESDRKVYAIVEDTDYVDYLIEEYWQDESLQKFLKNFNKLKDRMFAYK